MIARPYQVTAINSAIAELTGGRQRTLIVMPTGSGKTVTFGHIANHFLPMGRIMVVAHRDELIRQAADKIGRITNVMPAIEMGDERSHEESMHGAPQIVVSSVQTQNSGRARKRMHRFTPSEFSLLIIDEAHHAIADSYRAVINHYASNPDCKILGVTATADRADGEGMHQVFESVAFVYELPDIIADGYLVGIHQLSVIVEGLDFSKVRTTAGDLNAGDLEAAMLYEKPLHGIAYATVEVACGLERESLAGLRDSEDRTAVVERMIAGNKRKRTLVFAVSVAHAERLAEIFNRWIPDSAKFIHGGMLKDDRRRILRRYARGDFQFLVNCMIATEGFDEPGVELVVMARPTKSRPLYAQMVGRGTRPAADIAHELGEMPDAETRCAAIANSSKPFLQVLDFVGNAGKHRLVSTVDILGERYDAEVVAAARVLSEAGDIDVTDALRVTKEDLAQKKREAEAKAKQRAEERERQAQADAAKRAKLIATAGYSTREIDGFDRHGTRTNRKVLNPVSPNAATPPMVNLLIAFGVHPDTAKSYSKAQAGGVIKSYRSKNTKPDWKLLNAPYTPKELKGHAPLFAVPAADHEPGQWQQQKLRELGHTGAMPSNAEAAKQRIRELERKRGVLV